MKLENPSLYVLAGALSALAAVSGCHPSTPAPPEDLVVTITADPADGLAPLTVRFSASVTGGTGSYSYSWDLGDGTSSEEADLVHIYEVAGEFEVTLEVRDTQGGTGAAEVTITVGDDNTPVASASASPDRGIAPLTVSFTGAGIGGDAPLSYRWNFGDGSDEEDRQNPSHTFERPGSYTATLVVTDGDGDTATDSVEIEVFDNTVPVVEIEAEPTSGIAPLTVGFSAVVVGGDDPLAFAWDFGDGGSSAIQSPSHVFESGGSYTVTVTVTDENGDESSDSVVITVGDDQTPTVDATVVPGSGLAPLAVNFGADVSGGNEPYTFQWDFGDGTPTSELRNPAHTYVDSGTYTATVIVTDTDGDTASDTVTVEVGSDDIPSATANAAPISGIEPLSVAFTGVGVGGNPPLTYQWSFGDGSPDSDLQNPSHIYASAGVYTATLIVTDDDGDTASDTVRIEVASNAVPVVEASATPTSGIEPLTVSFSASVAGGDAPLSYLWDFGDGSPTSTSISPSHTFSEGTWTATVTVTDSNGDSDSDSVTIEVGGDDVPSVTATALPTSGNAPLPVSFSASVTGGNPPFLFNWNFGDGGSSSEQNPSHTFDVASTYTVTVSVQDADGDIASDDVEVAVADDALPIATASASPVEGVSPLTVSFFGTATGGDAPLTYEWTFGDGSPSSAEQNPTHEYTSGGTFTATLIVRDADGDSDSDSVTIQVSDDETPVTFVNATPTGGLTPLTVVLTCGASGGNPPLVYEWSFGDGSPVDESPDTTHRYDSPGAFVATCTVTDADGDSDSDSVTIHVGDTEVPAIDASATPMAGRFPLDVAFSADVVGGTPPYELLWDFGDGESSTEQNPSHTFAAVGVYTVSVQVTDFEGDSSIDTLEVSVLETESDLEIIDFAVTTTDVVTYSITVRNNGPDPAQNFYVDLFYDRATAPEAGEIGDQWSYVTDALAPGASTTIELTRPRAPITEQAWAAVDLEESLPDTDRANNLAGPLDVVVEIALINEVYYDAPGADGDSAFVEVYGTGGADLSGWSLVLVNGSDGEDTSTFVLPAGTLIPDDGFLVVADGAGVANADVTGLFDPQNGPDSIQLRDTTGAVIDAVAYGSFAAGEFPAGLGDPAADVDAGYTLGRGAGQPDTHDNATDFMAFLPSPGVANHFQNDACAAAFDLSLNAVNVGTTFGYTNDTMSSDTAGCFTARGNGPDAVFLLDLPADATVHLDTNGSDFDTVLYVRSTCDDPATELLCDDDGGDGLDSLIEGDLAAGTYYVIVDAYSAGRGGIFILNYWTL